MTGKSRFNYWLDITILTLFITTALTGLLLWLALPHGPGSRYLIFWGLSRDAWQSLHSWLSLFTLAGLTIHIVLHWRWIKCVAERYFGKTARQARINFTLNSLLFIAFMLVNLSGLIVWLVIPQGGYQGGRNPYYGATLLGLNRHGWQDIHLWASLAMMLIFLVHLALHWKWLARMSRRYLKRGYSCPPKSVRVRPEILESTGGIRGEIPPPSLFQGES